MKPSRSNFKNHQNGKKTYQSEIKIIPCVENDQKKSLTFET